MRIAVAVVEHEGRFLVGLRPPGVPLAGLWEFPGGKVHEGETPADAAMRECLEESRIATQVVGRFPDRIQQYEHGSVHLHFFACRPVDQDPPPPQPPFRWVDRQQLSRLAFPSGNRELLAQLLEAD